MVEGGAEGGGEEAELDVGDFAFAALDALHGVAADVPAGDGGAAGEVFLGEALAVAEAPDGGTDGVAVGAVAGARARHGRIGSRRLFERGTAKGRHVAHRRVAAGFGQVVGLEQKVAKGTKRPHDPRYTV